MLPSRPVSPRCSQALEFISLPQPVSGALYVMGSLSFSITLPLCNSLCAYYSRHGSHVNYGAGSGVGSLSFSFGSLGLDAIGSRKKSNRSISSHAIRAEIC